MPPAVTGAALAAAPDPLKAIADLAITAAAPELLALSHRLNDEPELAFQEHRAAGWIADALGAYGFAIERGTAGLPTALTARSGTGALVIGLCAEYDALPEIGHACGHNVIAAAAVGAALGLARVADAAGLTVQLLGTPAEEAGGGKALMLERGAFAGIHAAMLVHPGPFGVDSVPCRALACAGLTVTYQGLAAHAGAHPERGRNAADAATVAQVAIGLLRQQMNPHDRVHGIVTAGGAAANVIPDHVTLAYTLRAPTLAALRRLERRVLRCFRAGALATGCRVAVTHDEPAYAHFEGDRDLEALYTANLVAIGGRPTPGPDHPPGFSTDMGNVSLALPALHPTVGIDAGDAVNHQAAFAAHSRGPSADAAVLRGARAMARTAIDAALTARVRARLLAGRRRT